MKDLTLISINWNQQKATELMLKSYIKNHYKQELLNLILVDNGSNDNSKQWLIENQIPFISLPKNIGHEQAINYIYPMIKTKYALIVDTDILFLKNVYDEYIPKFNDKVKLIGEYITQHTPPLVPRIAAWFFFYDIAAVRASGINVFRDADNWIYDVASWQTEKILEKGFEFYDIKRLTPIENENTEAIGMIYDTHIHFGKTSWDIKNHADRVEEVNKRRNIISEKLNEYSDIDLKNKFI